MTRPRRTTRTVYLIHFDQPYYHARHYLGSAVDVDARMIEHQSGTGARLMYVVSNAGIPWRLARTWPGSRQLERLLKKRKNASHLCPVCTPGTTAGSYLTAKRGHRVPF